MTTHEQRMWALAAGDEVLMGRLKEIDRWFPAAKALNDAWGMVRDKLRGEEILRCFPNYDRQPAMGVLLWAMLEAESLVPEQREKWKVFRSFHFRLIQPWAPPLAQHPPQEVVMGIPAPGSRWLPIQIEEDEEHEEMEEATVPPRRRARTTPTPTSLPRRSPRFQRRSPRLLALSRRQ